MSVTYTMIELGGGVV